MEGVFPQKNLFISIRNEHNKQHRKNNQKRTVAQISQKTKTDEIFVILPKFVTHFSLQLKDFGGKNTKKENISPPKKHLF